MHARGAGAHGFFEVTKDITKYSSADFLGSVGKKTPVTARLSTVVHEKGCAVYPAPHSAPQHKYDFPCSRIIDAHVNLSAGLFLRQTMQLLCAGLAAASTSSGQQLTSSQCAQVARELARRARLLREVQDTARKLGLCRQRHSGELFIPGTCRPGQAPSSCLSSKMQKSFAAWECFTCCASNWRCWLLKASLLGCRCSSSGMASSLWTWCTHCGESCQVPCCKSIHMFSTCSFVPVLLSFAGR